MRRTRRRGSGLIEFAFGFSALALLFVGLADVSISMLVYHQLNAAVSNGARYASRVEFDEPAHRFAERVRNLVACGNPEGDPCPGTAPGLAPEHVKVSWRRDGAGRPETITVSIDGYAMPAVFSRRVLKRSALGDGAVRRELASRGRGGPPAFFTLGARSVSPAELTPGRACPIITV